MTDAALQALRGAAAAPPAAPRRARALVAGAGGRLGAALLAEALGSGGYAQVAAIVDAPLASALRGFEALALDALPRAGAFDTAFVVFEREQRGFGRDDAFLRPQPAQLPDLARALAEAGVRRLLVVTPHAPSLLPAALRSGFGSLDEAAVATLGFEQLVLLRPAQHALADPAAGRMQRFVGWWLSQLRWMVPAAEQPLLTPRLAQLAVQLALLLPRAAPGTRVVPPALLWQAATAESSQAVLEAWLNNARP